MFDGCTSLNHIVALFIPSISFYVNRYQNNWVRNVAPSGTFVCNKGRKGSWGTGNNYVPTGWKIVEL
jgi:hypothetical protein